MLHDNGSTVTLKSPFEAIRAERERQNKLYGVQRHDPERWMTILGEEFGSVCKCVLGQKDDEGMHNYIKELTHVAAVAVAAIECYEAR